MWLLVTVGKYFPNELGAEQIFCPHEKCVRQGCQIQSLRMVGLFFVPILPAGRVTEWRCAACGRHVTPNEEGKYSKNELLFSSVVAFGGFCMFALFTFWAFYIGGKGSAFNPESINVARGMLGFFGFCGLLIVAKALYEARRAAKDLSHIIKLAPDRVVAINQHLQDGDDIPEITSKLTAKNFSAAEIDTYLRSWVATTV